MNDTATNDTETQVEYRGTGFYVSLVFVAIVVIALLALTIQNTESVTFEFLWWDIDIPLFGIILIVAFLAVTIDELVGLVWRRIRRRRLSEQQELQQLRKERERLPGTSAATPASNAPSAASSMSDDADATSSG